MTIKEVTNKHRLFHQHRTDSERCVDTEPGLRNRKALEWLVITKFALNSRLNQ